MAPVVTLVGAPGSGKSTVGHLLADALGVGFIDTDEAVARTAQLSVGDIFLTVGEAGFRDLERAAALDAIARHDGVLSLGGGAVLAPQVREALATGQVVWLQVDAAAAVARVGLSGPRPMLLGNVRARWAELLQLRGPLYEEVAKWSVSTSGKSPQQVAAEVLHALQHTHRDA